MGRHLILRGVDRRLIRRIRERAAALALGPSELVRTLLTEQLGERAAPAVETTTSPQSELFDPRGRQVRGWTNKLIWGDNKPILSSLNSGPLREQIEEAGDRAARLN